MDPFEVRQRKSKLQKLVSTAIQIASQAVVETDSAILSKLAVASSLLALASNVDALQADRLFRAAKTLGNG